jgi:hypothetical protein
VEGSGCCLGPSLFGDKAMVDQENGRVVQCHLIGLLDETTLEIRWGGVVMWRKRNHHL